MASPSPTSNRSKHNELVSDLCIREKMQSLKVTTTVRNAASNIDDGFADKVQQQRDKFEKLGVVALPREGTQQDHVAIYTTIKSPPKKMTKGVLYILEHTEISGIFKIGWSKTSAEHRLNQSGNCYKFNTKIIYETEGGKFFGAFQAERITHAILWHKAITVYECPHCVGTHKEWFLISREEAFAIVKGVESWLQMPAYTLQQDEYKLSPKGESIYKSMLRFSMDEMNGLINNDNKSDNASDVFSGAKLATSVRQVGAPRSSFSAAKNGFPRGQIDGSHTAVLSVRQIPQKGVIRTQATANIREVARFAQGYQIRESDLNVEYDQVGGPWFLQANK